MGGYFKMGLMLMSKEEKALFNAELEKEKILIANERQQERIEQIKAMSKKKARTTFKDRLKRGIDLLQRIDLNNSTQKPSKRKKNEGLGIGLNLKEGLL